jgi:hypothetical protein
LLKKGMDMRFCWRGMRRQRRSFRLNLEEEEDDDEIEIEIELRLDGIYGLV